jgi:YidC/Oxa1 family membrane protein insertase
LLTACGSTGKDVKRREAAGRNKRMMDNKRLLIWATFGMLAWLTYQAWQADYGPASVGQPAPATEEAGASSQGLDSLPALPAASDDAPQGERQMPSLDQEPPSVRRAGGIVRVTTDVLDVEISTTGATVQWVALLKYPVNKDDPDIMVELLSPAGPNRGAIETGLIGEGDAPEPNHYALFTVPSYEYTLAGDDEIIVPFSWTDNAGLRVEKTLRFARGSYRIDVTQRIINDSDSDWRGAEYAQIVRRSREVERSMFNVDTYSFDGPIIYDGEKSEKLKRDDLADDGPFDIRARNGWVGSIEHHFLSAIVPGGDSEYHYNVSVKGDTSVASLIRDPSIFVRSGSEFSFETSAFVGPKLQSQLELLDENLKLTVDYGWLTIISQPLFWLLNQVHSFVGNWGLAIILVTILIKMVFYKLTEASGRSMAKMREIQPRMKALQDRYKDDRQALSQAMMELYKREKVNPAAGCLPILIQMPFFLAFYWVLLESVEMRQAPFALWIMDLSSRDPYFILPVIMGAAMLFQQRLNPAPADPMQAKVMQIMPIMFTGFFAFFPAGLVLYWVTNTLLSIAQQWYINKIVHEEAAARAGKKSKDKNKS